MLPTNMMGCSSAKICKSCLEYISPRTNWVINISCWRVDCVVLFSDANVDVWNLRASVGCGAVWFHPHCTGMERWVRKRAIEDQGRHRSTEHGIERGLCKRFAVVIRSFHSYFLLFRYRSAPLSLWPFCWACRIMIQNMYRLQTRGFGYVISSGLQCVGVNATAAAVAKLAERLCSAMPNANIRAPPFCRNWRLFMICPNTS